MAFISYAQNREDALLWRALSGVERGFYIDVGAADPVHESVTKAFSLAGWRGINIEPSVAAHTLLVNDRPNDINLCLAASEASGTLTFFSIGGGNGLSTSVSEIADQHASLDWPVSEETVRVETLSEICDRYAPADIHFLKIDVEGAERSVLLGADFTRHRPWVLAIEAIAPISLHGPDLGSVTDRDTLSAIAHDTRGDWEDLVLAADYVFVQFDGLNCFYVAAERADDLAPLLCTPVNVLDDVILAAHIRSTAATIAELDESRLALQQERDERAAQTAQLDSALVHVATLREELDEALTAQHRADERVAVCADELQRTRVELDQTYQTLYESSRALSSFAARAQSAQHAVHEHQILLQQQSTDIQRLQSAAERAEQAEAELRAVYATKAWRLTGPLRRLRRMTRRSGAGA